MSRAGLALFLLALLVPGNSLVAQDSTRRPTVYPHVGFYFPASAIAFVPNGNQDVRVGSRAAPSFGVAVTPRSSGRRLGTRADITFVPDVSVVVRELAGSESCGDNCLRYLYDNVPIGTSHLLLAVGDLVVQLPQRYDTQLYLMGGAGARLQWFTEETSEREYEQVLAEDARHFTLHAGLGLERPFGRTAISLEVEDFVGRFRMSLTDPFRHGTFGKHDVAVRLGVRIPVNR